MKNNLTVNDLRPAVATFVVEMERKLRKNDHKTGWRTYAIAALRRLLEIECNELDVALEFQIGDARSECIDIANFSMMLYDRLGEKDIVKTKNRAKRRNRKTQT